MQRNIFPSFIWCGVLLFCSTALQAQSSELSAEESAAAAANYQKYCALCHGEDRQGYANDAAPSLRSESLIRSGYPLHLAFAIGYGRHGTPMGGYFEEIGGPLSNRDIFQLVNWLKDQVPVEPIELGFDPVLGDAATGKRIYAEQCSVCHGENGQGELAPAIGNPAMLAITTDSFIRYAIEHGRDGTDMPAFRKILTDAEIDSVTAYLRSKATGWELERPVMRTPPSVEEYVLNPDGSPPQFDLQDGIFYPPYHNGLLVISGLVPFRQQFRSRHDPQELPLQPRLVFSRAPFQNFQVLFHSIGILLCHGGANCEHVLIQSPGNRTPI